ncbi:hypothetical protein ABFX02_04G083700 [Erythranthe guttata]
MEKIDQGTKDEFQELLQSLEQRTNWDGRRIVKYNDFWFPIMFFRPVLSAQKNFQAKDSDIILSTLPNSGSTWLKALTFSIANRGVHTIDQTPLLTSHPQALVPFLEFDLFWDEENPNLDHLSTTTNKSPRIFSTHIPFKTLSDSIRESKCKIIYLCRNPLDQFISFRQFLLANFGKEAEPLGLDETFDMFCSGIQPFGPFWEHMLVYWNAHSENPGKVLFLKYEDLKEDVVSNIKKIGEFLGCPFSSEEEEKGVMEEIAKICSFESLKNMKANKNGHVYGVVKKSSFFRKGVVGDWSSYLTPAMAERMKKLMEDKFRGSGLMFEI